MKPLYIALGEEKANALLGFHAFTGADTTGRFSGKTKALCFKTFLSCESHVLQAFGKLGKKKTDLPCDETAEALESFVCKLYSPRQKHTNTAELHWYLFSQKHAEGEKLPPTRGTLRPHICRAHYVTMIWVHADDPLPQLPSPTDYGWKEDNGRLASVWCLDPRAPQSILLLIKCACQKGCRLPLVVVAV